jgi:hypothetical protein
MGIPTGSDRKIPPLSPLPPLPPPHLFRAQIQSKIGGVFTYLTFNTSTKPITNSIWWRYLTISGDMRL